MSQLEYLIAGSGSALLREQDQFHIRFLFVWTLVVLQVSIWETLTQWYHPVLLFVPCLLQDSTWSKQDLDPV